MQTTRQALNSLKKGTRLTLCRKCKHQVIVSEFSSRDVEEDLIEIGLKCPNCGEWYHSYFLNTDLITNRPKPTDKRSIRRKYQKKLQAFQKKTRGRLGMKKVNGRWTNGRTVSSQGDQSQEDENKRGSIRTS